MSTTAATLGDVFDAHIFEEDNILWALANNQMASLKTYVWNCFSPLMLTPQSMSLRECHQDKENDKWSQIASHGSLKLELEELGGN